MRRSSRKVSVRMNVRKFFSQVCVRFIERLIACRHENYFCFIHECLLIIPFFLKWDFILLEFHFIWGKTRKKKNSTSWMRWQENICWEMMDIGLELWFIWFILVGTDFIFSFFKIKINFFWHLLPFHNFNKVACHTINYTMTNNGL